jgi:hypothetical protein
MTHVLPTGTTDFEEAAEAEERGEKEKAARRLERRSKSALFDVATIEIDFCSVPL